MSDITGLLDAVEHQHTRKTFYPTPPALAQKLLQDIDWKFVESVLEPSAGKGDLALCAAKELYKKKHRYCVYDDHSLKEAIAESDVDCIEIDPTLRNTLTGAGCRVVHDDFLTFETQKRYDLIVMNPPFDKGSEHLLKAIGLMRRRGGFIRCILNAETLRNPFCETRKQLLQAMGEYESKVAYIAGAFTDAERKTAADVAIVRIDIPRIPVDSTIMEDMRKAPTYKASQPPEQMAEMVRYNHIDEWVNRYNYEAACGIRLIEEYQAMTDMLRLNEYKSIITMQVDRMDGGKSDPDINAYLRMVRRKYWAQLFESETITGQLTSNLVQELRDSVDQLMNYDFSAYNILTLLIRMTEKVNQGIEKTIENLFDAWTARSWNEDSPNRRYYNGWKTNDCFAIGKKVIIPFYDAYSKWSGEFDSWRVIMQFSDIEKVFDFLDGGRTPWETPVSAIMKHAEATRNARNIDTKYFTVTFYKKGTAHLVFKNMELLEKFNLFAGMKKNWLPPCYGKIRYEDMTTDAQHVVDSFQGRERYEHIMANADYYLDQGQKGLPLLLTGGNKANQ